MKEKFAYLGIYVVFWIVLGKAGLLSSIYSINIWSYEVYSLWRLLGIALAIAYLLAIFWVMGKWVVLLLVSPLVCMAAIKAGYMGWLGYFFAFNNHILLSFLVAVCALAIYYLLLVSSIGLRKEVGIVLLLVMIGSVPVAYEPAKSTYRESTSNE